MASTASHVTMRDLRAARPAGSLSSRPSFRWQQRVIRNRVRSDDLVTFGAEKGDSLVSAILSVKYSSGRGVQSTAWCCLGQGGAGSGLYVEQCGMH